MPRLMPSSAMPVRLLTAAVAILFPLLNFAYWPRVLASGTLPPERDSIVIPMVESAAAAILAWPLVLGIAWTWLRRYDPATRILAFRRDRPLRSAAATLVLGGPAALLLVEAVRDAARVQPWYEYLWPAYAALVATWLLALRVGFVGQRRGAGP